jgi:RNA polymerase sigma-70 factor (ECF subfamily)
LRVVVGGKADLSPPEATDEQLVEAIEAGDGRLSEQIYERLVGVVDATLYRVMGRRESDHDDLVQSAFEQIILTISRRKYARACNLKAWAATLASHVGLNALRSRCRERKLIDRHVPGGGESPMPAAPLDVERQVGSRRELDRLREELAQMDQDRALAVLLHDALGHDLAEVAVLSGCSVAAAQSRLVRGRRELARRMAPVGAGEKESG